jgi:large subunit ribosomal protein L4e
MKIDVLDLEGKKVKSIELPMQFNEDFEPHLIKRAVVAFLSKLRTPYGAYPEAGNRQTGKLSRRRRDYKGSYGKGISRVPRKILWRRGMQFGWAGATVSGTVGGRKAHSPKAEKIWAVKINKKEKSKAMRSLLAGLVENKKIVVAVSELENVKKTKDAKNVLLKLGFETELKRVEKRKVRAGKGTMRGRKYRNKVGPLMVTSKDIKTYDNVAGCASAVVGSLNPSMIAQDNGDMRHVIFSEEALKIMSKEGLFRSQK